MNQMKKNFVFISDTHCQHKMLELPKGDVIIHCGDVSSRGNEYEVKAFLNWFSLLPFAYKIFIPGNHDFYFEKASKFIIDALMAEYPEIILLNDSSTTIDGIKIWGSPITPYFHNWAFNRYRGSDIERYWDLIDEDTDILISHGPPAYMENNLSRVIEGEDVGCQDLGHAHGGHGSFPMRADHHDGARRAQGLRQLRHGRAGRAGLQGKGGGAVGDKKDVA